MVWTILKKLYFPLDKDTFTKVAFYYVYFDKFVRNCYNCNLFQWLYDGLNF